MNRWAPYPSFVLHNCNAISVLYFVESFDHYLAKHQLRRAEVYYLHSFALSLHNVRKRCRKGSCQYGYAMLMSSKKSETRQSNNMGCFVHGSHALHVLVPCMSHNVYACVPHHRCGQYLCTAHTNFTNISRQSI